MQREGDLAIMFRGDQPRAGYFSLVKGQDRGVARSELADCGLVVDYGHDGRVVGIELTVVDADAIEALNDLLNQLGRWPVSQEDLASFGLAGLVEQRSWGPPEG